MKVKDICSIINLWAPEIFSENFDNVGLIIGDENCIVNKILITIDSTEEVIKEALSLNCNLIISYHPILFKKLSRINNSKYYEKSIFMALKNDISIYVIHTNLDNHPYGTNYYISNILGLKNCETLIESKNFFKKLTTYIPEKYSDKLMKKLFDSGAGNIGNYKKCSYNIKGFGTYLGNEESSPFFGKKNIFNKQKEISINVIFPYNLESKIIEVLLKNHPYEEVPYEIFQLYNKNSNGFGQGIIGYLSESISEKNFLKIIKNKMKTSLIRHSSFLNNSIQKIAILGGSGSFALYSAKKKKADVFISSDFKYHQFFEANKEIFILDIGHYESEQFNKELLLFILKKKIPNFDIIISKTITNPVYYYY